MTVREWNRRTLAARNRDHREAVTCGTRLLADRCKSKKRKLRKTRTRGVAVTRPVEAIRAEKRRSESEEHDTNTMEQAANPLLMNIARLSPSTQGFFSVV